MSEAKATRLKFLPVPGAKGETIAIVSLNRPEVANAFSELLISELTQQLETLAEQKGLRAVVIKGQGKHFSAGADLGWMKSAAKLTYEENVADAGRLIKLFEALTNLPVPTIACVQGAAYGGAVGLVAACDIAIAEDSARFCLSEVKIGLIPAVILPYLARKFHAGQLRRHALTGRVFSAAEAESYGLIEKVIAPGDLDSALREELNACLAGAPEAQGTLKKLHRQVLARSYEQGAYTAAAIATARTSTTGQAGLQAFFDKKPAPWTRTLDEEFTLDDA